MLQTELIVICDNTVLLDEGEFPKLEISGEKAEDNAKALMKAYLGLTDNWYTLVQSGYFDDEVVGGRRVGSILYVTVLFEKVPVKCNLAKWVSFSDVSNRATFNKLAYALKVTLPSQ